MTHPTTEQTAALVHLRQTLVVLDAAERVANYDPYDGPCTGDATALAAFEAALDAAIEALEAAEAARGSLALREQPTELVEADGLSFVGVTRRELRCGDAVVWRWSAEVVGTAQQFSSSFVEEELDLGEAPPASFLTHRELELSHPGFPTNYVEALAWSGQVEE